MQRWGPRGLSSTSRTKCRGLGFCLGLGLGLEHSVLEHIPVRMSVTTRLQCIMPTASSFIDFRLTALSTGGHCVIEQPRSTAHRPRTGSGVHLRSPAATSPAAAGTGRESASADATSRDARADRRPSQPQRLHESRSVVRCSLKRLINSVKRRKISRR